MKTSNNINRANNTNTMGKTNNKKAYRKGKNGYGKNSVKLNRYKDKYLFKKVNALSIEEEYEQLLTKPIMDSVEIKEDLMPTVEVTQDEVIVEDNSSEEVVSKITEANESEEVNPVEEVNQILEANDSDEPSSDVTLEIKETDADNVEESTEANFAEEADVQIEEADSNEVDVEIISEVEDTMFAMTEQSEESHSEVTDEDNISVNEVPVTSEASESLEPDAVEIPECDKSEDTDVTASTQINEPVEPNANEILVNLDNVDGEVEETDNQVEFPANTISTESDNESDNSKSDSIEGDNTPVIDNSLINNLPISTPIINDIIGKVKDFVISKLVQVTAEVVKDITANANSAAGVNQSPNTSSDNQDSQTEQTENTNHNGSDRPLVINYNINVNVNLFPNILTNGEVGKTDVDSTHNQDNEPVSEDPHDILTHNESAPSESTQEEEKEDFFDKEDQGNPNFRLFEHCIDSWDEHRYLMDNLSYDYMLLYHAVNLELSNLYLPHKRFNGFRQKVANALNAYQLSQEPFVKHKAVKEAHEAFKELKEKVLDHMEEKLEGDAQGLACDFKFCLSTDRNLSGIEKLFSSDHLGRALHNLYIDSEAVLMNVTDYIYQFDDYIDSLCADAKAEFDQIITCKNNYKSPFGGFVDDDFYPSDDNLWNATEEDSWEDDEDSWNKNFYEDINNNIVSHHEDVLDSNNRMKNPEKEIVFIPDFDNDISDDSNNSNNSDSNDNPCSLFNQDCAQDEDCVHASEGKVDPDSKENSEEIDDEQFEEWLRVHAKDILKFFAQALILRGEWIPIKEDDLHDSEEVYLDKFYRAVDKVFSDISDNGVSSSSEEESKEATVEPEILEDVIPSLFDSSVGGSVKISDEFLLLARKVSHEVFGDIFAAFDDDGNVYYDAVRALVTMGVSTEVINNLPLREDLPWLKLILVDNEGELKQEVMPFWPLDLILRTAMEDGNRPKTDMTSFTLKVFYPLVKEMLGLKKDYEYPDTEKELLMSQLEEYFWKTYVNLPTLVYEAKHEVGQFYLSE